MTLHPYIPHHTTHHTYLYLLWQPVFLVFWPLWYHRLACVSIETVGPCHHQVLSDLRMVASRQKCHTSGSCTCRIRCVYFFKCTGHVDQEWGQSCIKRLQSHKDSFWCQVEVEIPPQQCWERYMTDAFLTQLTWIPHWTRDSTRDCTYTTRAVV